MKFMTEEQLCCVGQAPAVGAEEAETLAELLGVLADPVRLRIISMIAASPTGEICACDLPAALDRSQPTISHHLKQLVNAGICQREQRGKWAWFQLQPARLEAVREALLVPTAV